MTKQKPKTKRVGKLPVNSRVHINYSGDKPKIKFSYPDKDSTAAVLGSPVYMILLLIFAVLGSYVYNSTSNLFVPILDYNKPDSFLFHEQYSRNLPDANTTLAIINISYLYRDDSKLKGFDLALGNQTYSYTIVPQYDIALLGYHTSPNIYLNQISPGRTSKDAALSTLALLYGVLVVLIIPFYLTKLICSLLPLSKKFNSIFPKINAITALSGYYIKFKKCPKDKIIEIPLFTNVYLNYVANGQFSKYLTDVKIVEHPFAIVTLKKKLKKKSQLRKEYENKSIGSRIKTQKKNIWLWKAQFIFSKQPKQGYLEVLFD